MFHNIFNTDLGEVRVSDHEMRALKTAERVWQSRWPRWGILPPPISDYERRALDLAGSIIDACNRFAKHKYGGDNAGA